MSRPLPVRVPLVTEPWGILKSLAEARRNVLSIIPDIATKQPMVCLLYTSPSPRD